MAGQRKEMRADKTERGVSFLPRGESEETVPSSLPPNFFSRSLTACGYPQCERLEQAKMSVKVMPLEAQCKLEICRSVLAKRP